MVIGIDLDSTLSNMNEKWLKIYNEEYDDNLTLNDLTMWDWYKITKPECGARGLMEILLRPGFFYEDIRPNEGSQEVTRWLIKEKKQDIYIVTSYCSEVTMDKTKWLIEHFPHIPSRNIIFINNKALFDGDVLIDDSGDNIEAFTNKRPSRIGLLYDGPCPWNHEYTHLKRVHSWWEIQRFFEEILA